MSGVVITAASFAGEYFLEVKLPNYELECSWLTIYIVVAVVVWCLVFPILVSSSNRSSKREENNKNTTATTTTTTTKEEEKIPKSPPPTTTTTTTTTGKRKKKKNNNKNTNSNDATTPTRTDYDDDDDDDDDDTETLSTTNVPKESTHPLPRHCPPPPLPVTVVVVVPWWANPVAILGAMITVVWLVWTQSPYNYFTPRRVFVFPLLTELECHEIVEMAHSAAALNYQMALEWQQQQQQQQQHQNNNTVPLIDVTTTEATTMEQTYQTMLQEPTGWHKLRHGSYPTTDLNLVTDPFTAMNRTWLTDHVLNPRLAPILSRIYGIPSCAIRAIDMFVVRYDANIQTHLERHTDEGDISFTVLLNQQFQGGGTRFWKRTTTTTTTDRPFAHVEPTRLGTTITNHALINHEGYPITNGTRFILVGFTNVDRYDPWQTTATSTTGLSWYASWLNIAWLNVKFKNGYFHAYRRMEQHTASTTITNHNTNWMDSQWMRLLCRDMTLILQYMGDIFAPHTVEHLVPDHYTNAFLQALDQDYQKRQEQQQQEHQQQQEQQQQSQPNWWKGQMVDLNFVGKVDSYWLPRAANRQRFLEL